METKNNKTAPTKENQEVKRPIDIARENLKLLSLEVKDLVEDGTFFSINDAIVESLYKDDTHREFKSFRQWKKEGYHVNKGEKAFLLWAKPKQIQKPIEDGKAEEDIDEMLKFFPIAYLFSNAQVSKIETEGNEDNQEPETEQQDQPANYLEPLVY